MRQITSKAPAVARYLLGTIFFVFGLNGFLGFIPQPAPPPDAGSFLGALAATGYMFPLIKGTEVLAGLLLLGKRFVPLALLLLAPIVVNIFAYHAFLDPAGMGMTIAIVALQLYVAWTYRDSFRAVLAAKAEPPTSGQDSQLVAEPARA